MRFNRIYRGVENKLRTVRDNVMNHLCYSFIRAIRDFQKCSPDYEL